MTPDGILSDVKEYEIFKTDYLNYTNQFTNIKK